MKTPEIVKDKALRLDALLEAFETTYIPIASSGEGTPELRERACIAFYDIRALIEEVIDGLNDFAGTILVCEAILAANKKSLAKEVQ